MRARHFEIGLKGMIAALCLSATVGPTPVAGAPIIRGDAQLLETVKAALERNQQALGDGECDLHLEYSQDATEENSYSTTADVHLLWTDERSYSSYTYTEDYPGDGPLRESHGAQIISGEARTVFAPESRRCYTSPFQAGGSPTYRDVHPAENCFHWDHTRGVPWTKFLEGTEALQAIELSREGTTIHVKLLWMEDAYTLLEFSESHGCNIVSWESSDGDGNVTNWGKQEWSEVEGVWYPTLSMHEQHHDGPDGLVVLKFSLKMSGFDPDPAIPANAFTIEALELPNGTELVERDATGRQVGESRMIGTRDPAEEQRAALEALVEEARTTGFARKERTE